MNARALESRGSAVASCPKPRQDGPVRIQHQAGTYTDRILTDRILTAEKFPALPVRVVPEDVA